MNRRMRDFAHRRDNSVGTARAQTGV